MGPNSSLAFLVLWGLWASPPLAKASVPPDLSMVSGPERGVCVCVGEVGGGLGSCLVLQAEIQQVPHAINGCVILIGERRMCLFF